MKNVWTERIFLLTLAWTALKMEVEQDSRKRDTMENRTVDIGFKANETDYVAKVTIPEVDECVIEDKDCAYLLNNAIVSWARTKVNAAAKSVESENRATLETLNQIKSATKLAAEASGLDAKMLYDMAVAKAGLVVKTPQTTFAYTWAELPEEAGKKGRKASA